MILVTQDKIEEYVEKGFWGTETLYDLFIRNVKQTPAKLAIVDPLNRESICSGTLKRLSYEELYEEVDKLSTSLVKNGVQKDDIIAIQLPNTIEVIISYLAILRIGAIATPLPIQFRKNEYKKLLNFVEAKAVITMDKILKHETVQDYLDVKSEIPSLEFIFVWGENIPENVISLNQLEITDEDRAITEKICKENNNTANDIFTICWTSGTEGSPKGVPRSHNEWLVSAYGSVDAVNFTKDDILLNTFPMINMAGIGGMLVPWLITSNTLIMHQPFDLSTFLKQIKVEQATYTLAPPALLNMILNSEEIMKTADFSSLRAIGSGSAPLSPWMVAGWKNKYNIDVYNYFGSNEGATFISGPKDIPDPKQRANFFPRLGVEGLNWKNRIANYFESRLVDPETNEVITENNRPGEMRLKGATVLNGYWNQDEVNKNSFDEDGFFCTGDLFEIIEEDGVQKFYRFVGRSKEVIIRGGVNISPDELEYLLQAHPKVAEVSVVGIPHKIMGEKACACVVLKEPDNPLTLDEMIEYFKESNYATYKVPEYLYFINELPRNPVGKILKHELSDKIIDNNHISTKEA